AAASRTSCNLRSEAANSQRLKNLLRHNHFFRAVAVGGGRERNANGIADAFLQQNSQSGGTADDALGSHARFRQSEVQRIVAAASEVPVHINQILDTADLGAEQDVIVRQAGVFGDLSRTKGAYHHGFHGDVA